MHQHFWPFMEDSLLLKKEKRKKQKLEKVRRDLEFVGAEAGRKSTEFEGGDLRLAKLHLTA